MPTPALYQHCNTPTCHGYKLSSLRKLRDSPASLSRLQAVPTRNYQRTPVQVLVYGCAAEGTSSNIGSQHQNQDILTPNGRLQTSQAAQDRRPILSGGGGGIFFFWQLGIHLSLLHALSVPALPLPHHLQYLRKLCQASQAPFPV